MKPRTCPYCHNQVSYKKYLKTMSFQSPADVWKCDNCKKPITFNFLVRLLLAVLTGLWVFVIIRLKDLLDFNVLNMIGLGILAIAGSLLIFYFDYFTKDRKEKK